MSSTDQFRNSGSVHPLTLIETVASIMRDNDIRLLPVVENGELKGILTDRDLVRRCLAEGRDFLFAKAADYMTRRVKFCEVGESAPSVAARMKLNGHTKFPVLGADREFLGMLDLEVCRRAMGKIRPELLARRTLYSEEGAEPQAA